MVEVQGLDFDILIPGHGDAGEKADVDLYLDFLRALQAAVANGVADGRSLEELLESVYFPGYEVWIINDARRLTLITETYDVLSGN